MSCLLLDGLHVSGNPPGLPHLPLSPMAGTMGLAVPSETYRQAAWLRSIKHLPLAGRKQRLQGVEEGCGDEEEGGRKAPRPTLSGSKHSWLTLTLTLRRGFLFGGQSAYPGHIFDQGPHLSAETGLFLEKLQVLECAPLLRLPRC